MTINIIVAIVLVFATCFSFVWLVRRDLREKIETPKYQFQHNVQNYDQHFHDDKANLNSGE